MRNIHSLTVAGAGLLAGLVLTTVGAPKANAMPADVREAACIDAITSDYAVEPEMVELQPEQQVNGKWVIDASIDLGLEGIKTFQCHYGSDGKFADLTETGQ